MLHMHFGKPEFGAPLLTLLLLRLALKAQKAEVC